MRRLCALAEIPIALFAIYFLFGALTAPLTPPLAKEAPVIQLIGMGLGAFAIVAVALRPLWINRIITTFWPVLIPPVFALLSAMWSVDPGISLRRSGALLIATVIGMWLVQRFSPKVLFRLLLTAGALVCAASWINIFVNPHAAIHQSWEQYEFAQYAGAWRGVYAHKNDFGRVVALIFVLFATGFAANKRGRVLMAIGLVQAALLIAFSQSSQSILLAVIPAAAVVFIALTRTMPVSARTVVLVVSVPVGLVLIMISGVIVGNILTALGKDATLTGRTDIWGAVVIASGPIMALGGGFGTGWEVVHDRVVAMTAIDVGHAHNGYLDLLTDLGIPGVLMMIAFGLILIQKSLRISYSPSCTALAILGVGYGLFYLFGNIAGSFLLLHNSIYWTLPMMIGCYLLAQEAQWRRSRLTAGAGGNAGVAIPAQ